MKNNFTFITYICSKDPNKLYSFIRSLGVKIEHKASYESKGKHYIIFTHADHIGLKDTKIIDLDLDKI